MRDSNNGSVPEAQLAELNSDVHHLETDFKEHRIEVARRHADERKFREAITLSHATVRSQLTRLEETTKGLEQTAKDHVGVMFELRGAIKIVGAIAAAVPLLLEAWRHIHP